MQQFDNRNLKASHGLQKHDLSYRNAFTSHFGMLLPFMVCDVVGNSRVQISLEHQTRTLPLNTAAFVRLREHYDYFFVPYAQLYGQYDNFKTQQSNQKSMLDANAFPNIVTKLPTFDNQAIDNCLQQFTNQLDPAGYSSGFGAQRLFDLLGYGHHKSYNPVYPVVNNIPNLSYNPFRLLAYQKIYFDYYRNDKYEKYATSFFNVDDVASAGVINTTRLRQLTRLHYRWRRKDYFTQVTPDLLPSQNQFNRDGFNSIVKSFSSNNTSQFYLPTAGVTSGVVTSSISGVIGSPENTTPTSLGGSNVVTNNSTNAQNLSQQSAAQHRLIEVRQRLLERMYAANSDFSSQMLAIYGYAPIEGRHGKVKHLGGFSELLNVTDVNDTTSNYAQSAGTFGKINNYGSSKNIKFHVPEDGIIMGIYSTDCMPDYSSRRVDRFNFKSVPEDYFNPFYEGLGKQALFGVEYSTFVDDDVSGAGEVAMPNGIMGFIPRYAEYKAKVDEVHNQLDYGGVYENYTSAFNVDIKLSSPMLHHEYMINKPAQLGNLFNTVFDGSDGTDCFMINLYNQIKVLAPIRKNSEL